MSSHPVDVLVIGAGITGAGVAWDAVTRGYRVAVVERDDVASGTSSKSSKLVHGGMRYLATGDLAMVSEGVRERELLRRLAPHLVRPLSFVVPVDNLVSQAMMQTGLLAYDAIGLTRGARTHRRLRPQEVYELAGLTRLTSRGGFLYYDAQTDDARLTLQVLQQARHAGALVLNHAEVSDVILTGGRVTGAEVRDRIGGAEFELSARWVVDATGVWAGGLAALHEPGDSGLTPAKGVHLSFASTQVPISRAVVIPSVAGDGRHVFLIPWGQQVYVGTTDDAYEGSLTDPAVSVHDADYLLSSVNHAFGSTLTVEDAIGAWAGLRPLIKSQGKTADLSRRHLIVEEPPGLVTITGGKLTTFRQMGEDAVDHLSRADGLRLSSRTARLPLGAVGRARDGLERTRTTLASLGIEPELAGSLYHRHGDKASAVAARAAAAGEAGRLLEGLPYLVGEVRHAVREELALTLDDVLSRRLRVAIRHREAGGDAIDTVADIMADELGWDASERHAQIEAYLDRVSLERGPVPLPRS